MSKNWCFTLNNYTSQEVEAINALVPDKVGYVVYGFETAPTTGTPHLQGYVQLVKKSQLTALTKMVKRANWLKAKGTPEQNFTYCTKEGNYHELGNQTHERQRSDLDALKDSIKEGTTLKRLREEFSEVYAKYPRFVHEYIRDQVPIPVVPPYPLKPWQQELNVKLNLPPHDREVVFLVDPIGNTGKTWFSKYYCSLHENAQILESSKKADMAHALRQDIRVLFVSCTRTQNEFLNYSFLEAVKDQMVFSSKYESGMKMLLPCHVVVIMNTVPDMAALSVDRYTVIYL